MANSKARCVGCKQYFLRAELTSVGLSNVCGDECRRKVLDRQRERSVRQESNRLNRSHKPRVPSRVRKTVRDRDKKCVRCGVMWGRLEQHHCLYKSQGGPDSPYNLVLLCDDCHRTMHSRKKYWQPVLLAYIWLLYVEGLKNLTVPQVERILKKRRMLPGTEPDPDDGVLID